MLEIVLELLHTLSEFSSKVSFANAMNFLQIVLAYALQKRQVLELEGGQVVEAPRALQLFKLLRIEQLVLCEEIFTVEEDVGEIDARVGLREMALAHIERRLANNSAQH